jgi:hypothetical protein
MSGSYWRVVVATEACLHEIERLQAIERGVRGFLPWFKTFVGGEAYAEISCRELDALRAALETLAFEWPCMADLRPQKTHRLQAVEEQKS